MPMAMNRAQVAAIERGLCGSLPQRRAAAASDGGLCRHQTPRADHVVGESVPQRDGLDLVHAAHKKLRQPAITCLGVGALRGRGPLLVDRFGVVTAHTVSPVGHARRIAGLRGMAVPIGVARLRHRHEGLDAVLGQRFDVVELGEAAVGEMLARSRAVRPGRRSSATSCPCRSRCCRPTHRRWRCSWCRWRIGRYRPAGNHRRPSS